MLDADEDETCLWEQPIHGFDDTGDRAVRTVVDSEGDEWIWYHDDDGKLVLELDDGDEYGPVVMVLDVQTELS